MKILPIACRVCGDNSQPAFSGPLLNHHVQYFDCPRCGYFQTETPHWLAQAYASPINVVDTGIAWRNQRNTHLVVMTLAALGRLDGQVVDHAGGYGLLVRMLRDQGVDAMWRDKYCENLFARGFEHHGGRVDLTTAFEVLEHLDQVRPEMQALLADAPAALVSTELIRGEGPPAPDWWYLGPEHGQHIGFFRLRTLQWLAQDLGWKLLSDGKSLHLFTQGPAPSSWKTLIRLKSLAPVLARRRLSSRVGSDHEALRRRSPTP
jgi:hypothetical protein